MMGIVYDIAFFDKSLINHSGIVFSKISKNFYMMFIDINRQLVIL
jgi:hypothetical protein